MLNILSTELRIDFSQLFNPKMPEEAKTIAKEKLASRLGWLNGELEGKQFLMGDTFSVADAYLFTVTNWGQFVGVDVSPFANIVAHSARVEARPAVHMALKAEGLLK